MDPGSAKTVAAATGATITALTMTPFDVVKTRIQTQPASQILHSIPINNRCCQPFPANCVRNMSSLARPLSQEVVCLLEDGMMRAERCNGFWDAVLKVSRTEGIRGLWKGVGTTLGMTVPSATIYMVAYDHLLRNVMPTLAPSPHLSPLLSGILARTLVSTAASPLELFRTNLQSTPKSSLQPNTVRSVLHDLRGLVRSQGAGALWRGLGPTLWRDVPFSGLYWAGYESCRSSLEHRGYKGPSTSFLCGFVSGTSAAVLTSPFDVLKTRRQALLMSLPTKTRSSASSLTFILNIMRAEGVGALFAGLSPRIAKIAPACGIMIACFEGIGKTLTRGTHPES